MSRPEVERQKTVAVADGQPGARDMTGWLRSGLTGLSDAAAWLTAGGVLRRLRLSGRVTVQEITVKRTDRTLVSTAEGASDYARGFWRAATPATISPGGVLRRMRLNQRINALYVRAFQADTAVDRAAEYGRLYVADPNTDLKLNGVAGTLRVGEELVVYHVTAEFLDATPLWDTLPASESDVYAKEGY